MHIHAHEQKKEELEKVLAKLEKKSYDYNKKKGAGAAEVRQFAQISFLRVGRNERFKSACVRERVITDGNPWTPSQTKPCY